MINLALIGCGYWGPNLLRNFEAHPDCSVKMVAELDSERVDYIHSKYPNVKTTADHTDVYCDSIDAVVIATPPPTHYELAKEALLSNKHVLVEKPLAQSTVEAEELISIAKERGLKLMVGHTFEYNSAVKELKHQVMMGTVGDPYYIYAQRLNFGIVRKDVNALWNLAPHDVSILIYLLDCMPLTVSARGYDFIQKGIEDVVFMVLQFPNNVIAHVQVSWLDPGKTRKMTVVGSKKMVVYDDMADAKIQVFDKGITKKNITDSLGRYDNFGEYQLIKSAGDVTHPKIDFEEPLKEETSDFIDSIIEDRQPLTNGENGLRVVRVLETAQASMDLDGVALSVRNHSVVPSASMVHDNGTVPQKGQSI